MMTTTTVAMRASLLCQHFARNLAYYRSAWNGRTLTPSKSQFWLTVNGNCVDICVLEWCKLFGDAKGVHFWSRVVADRDAFAARLLHHLSISQEGFQQKIDEMRRYRDRFVAHLDSEDVMNIPQFNIPKAAVWLLHDHLVDTHPEATTLSGVYADLDDYYQHCVGEAKAVYSAYR